MRQTASETVFVLRNLAARVFCRRGCERLMPAILMVFFCGLLGGWQRTAFATGGSRVESRWPISGLHAAKRTWLPRVQLPLWPWRAAGLESAITGVPPDQNFLALAADRGGGGPTGGGRLQVLWAATARSAAQAVLAG